METFITVAEAAEKWELTNRRVQLYCNEGRIAGAIKRSGIWLIPSGAIRPTRIKSGVKKEIPKDSLNVLSLFSGCGGMDLGFEGGFTVLKESVNQKINLEWKIHSVNSRWV